MNMQAVPPSVAEVAAFERKLAALDLEPIKVKLMDQREGLGWALEQCDVMEKHYKHFLLLKFKYPQRRIVPTKAVDQFWHQHILDTMKYAEDCSVLFGYFLHHFPYFGMRSEEDAANLEVAFHETMQTFQNEFGEAPPAASGMCCCDDG